MSDQENRPEEAPGDAPRPPAEPGGSLPPEGERPRARPTSGAAGRPRSPEERQAERAAERAAKARARRAGRSQTRARAAERRSANPPAPAPPTGHGPGRRKVRQGVVVSDKADKTIIVRIDMARRHRRYERIVRSSSTLHAHDEANDAHTGDTVRVVESRPLSRTKRWRLVDVLERAR